MTGVVGAEGPSGGRGWPPGGLGLKARMPSCRHSRAASSSRHSSYWTCQYLSQERDRAQSPEHRRDTSGSATLSRSPTSLDRQQLHKQAQLWRQEHTEVTTLARLQGTGYGL